MTELEQAISIANRFLDDGDSFGRRDPDGDECVLARQFNRLRERADDNRLFDVLHQVALERGHKADPAESPFDFLQRLVARP